MKKFIDIILGILLAFAALYLFCSFVALDFDFIHWAIFADAAGRFFFAVIITDIILFFSTMNLRIIRKNE